MKLYFETILNFYTLKNRKILCQIKVNRKNHAFKSTCRCLSEEQWKIFDNELEKLLTVKDFLNNEKYLQFTIKPYVEVKVQKSKLSYKYFGKFFGGNGKYDNAANDIVLECLIEYPVEVRLSPLAESQEYEPQIDISVDGKLSSQLQYEPYTPSIKNLAENNINIIENISTDNLKYNEDTYCPKPIFDVGAIDTHLKQSVPKYTPAPINTSDDSKEKNKFSILNYKLKNESDKKLEYSDKHKNFKTKLKKKTKRIECEYIPRSQKVTRTNVPVYIPTPIQETTSSLSVFKTDNIRQYKRRSNTIDVFPEQLDESIVEMKLQKLEELASDEKHSYCPNKKFKKRSMTIDKIPAAFADVPVYIPTPKEELALPQNHSRRDVLPVVLDVNTKENYPSDKEHVDNKKKDRHCEKKNLKKRSMTIDQIPVDLEEFNMLHKGKKNVNEEIVTPFEKIPEKLLKASLLNEYEFTAIFDKNLKTPSKTQALEIEEKIDDNKVDKNITLQKSIANSCHNATRQEKAGRKDRKKEIGSTETNKSYRRSERAPSKPKRLIEEQCSSVNKMDYSKKHNFSPKNKELFGTDDDEDDDGHCFGNKNEKKANSSFSGNAKSKNSSDCHLSSPSMKRKRKIDKSCENVDVKLDRSKRLPQTKIALLNDEATKSRKDTRNYSSNKLSTTKFKSQTACNDVETCENYFSYAHYV